VSFAYERLKREFSLLYRALLQKRPIMNGFFSFCYVWFCGVICVWKTQKRI